MRALTPRTRNVLLWTAQILLAALFLFAGVSKLRMPAEVLSQGGPFSADFLRFISWAEVAGALGLVLPGALRVARGLTPLAAAGLAVIMVGATVFTFVSFGVPGAVLPGVTGIVTVLVMGGRRSWAAAQPRHALSS